MLMLLLTNAISYPSIPFSPDIHHPSKGKLQYLLDCTTAWVCAEVPDAMLVNAHAASNCNEGL